MLVGGENMSKGNVVVAVGWLLVAGLMMVDCCMLCDLVYTLLH